MAASAAMAPRNNNDDVAAELRNTSTLIANETLNDLLLVASEEAGIAGSGGLMVPPKTIDSGEDTENTVGIYH